MTSPHRKPNRPTPAQREQAALEAIAKCKAGCHEYWVTTRDAIDSPNDAMLNLRRIPWGAYRRAMEIILPAAAAFFARADDLARPNRAMQLVKRQAWMAGSHPPPHLFHRPLLVWLEYTPDAEAPCRWPAVATYDGEHWCLAQGDHNGTVTHYRPVAIAAPDFDDPPPAKETNEHRKA